MSIRLDFDSTLKEKIANLPQEMLTYAEEVLTKQCDLIVSLAQIYVPVDTGSLRNSIRKERGGEGLYWRQYRVRAGGYVTNPRTQRKVDYALYVETRTPFLHPAVYEVLPTIAGMIQANVVEKVNE
jgi:hypothetical protein